MKDDEIWGRDEIESPCTKVCVVHPAERICTGCYRTLDEIAGWAGLTPEDRKALMAELPARAPRLAKRRGGRSGRLGRTE